MDRRKGPSQIDQVVGGILRKLESGTGKKGDAVRTAWERSATQKTAEHTQPVSFKKGVLMVIVENTTWLYKLTMEKRDLVKKFNEEYTVRQKLIEIRFRVGKTDL